MGNHYPKSDSTTTKKAFTNFQSLVDRSLSGEAIDGLSQFVLDNRKEKKQGIRFEGPTLGEALSSLNTWLDPNQLDLVDPSLLNTVVKCSQLFLCRFYLQGQGLLRTEVGKPTLDLWKKCDKALQKMLESTKLIDEVDQDLYLVYGNNFSKAGDINHLCKKWILISVAEDEEEPIIILEKDWGCRCYSPLFKAMILVVNRTLESLRIYPEESDQIRQLDQLANHILSIGRLYQLFNPSKTELDEEVISLKEMLEATDKGGENSPYHVVCLEEVKALFEDCRRYTSLKAKAALGDQHARDEMNKIIYCRDFANALEKFRKIDWTFTDEDWYCSNKSSPSRNKKYKDLKASLLKSGFEYDPFIGCAFDQLTGYPSGYLSEEEAIKLGTTVMEAMTKEITNPSKCKGRGIHLLFNAAQDRMNLIHRRLIKLLELLVEDCTKHQNRGVDFIKSKSSASKRKKGGYNLYASDFTNATDTLSQQVQELVLSEICPPEVVEFWHVIASMPKRLHLYGKRSGEWPLFTQNSGQPQGALGSFDAFAIVHHVIMLCTMRSTGRSGMKAEDFYRVLGDDSAICTITSDRNCPTLEALQDKDFNPVWGRSVLDNYFILSLWSNFKVNFDKTTVVRSDDPVALIDFAKVTVREGKTFSPIPVRLFYFAIGKSESDLLPGFLWNADHEGWVKFQPLRDKISSISDRPDWFLDSLYFSGVIPCFKNITIEDDSRDEVTEGRVALSYIVATIQQNIVFSFLPDSVKEAMVREFDLKKSSYEAFVQSSKRARGQFEDLLTHLSSDHKIVYALVRNSEIEDCIRGFMSGLLDIPDTLYWSPYLEVTNEMIQGLRDLASLLEVTRAEPDRISDRLLASLKPILDSLSEWDKYTFRSDYKKSKLASSVSATSFEVFNKLFMVETTN